MDYVPLLLLLSSFFYGGFCAKCMTPDDARYLTPFQEISEEFLGVGWHTGNYFPSPASRASSMLLTTRENSARMWWLKERDTDLYMILTSDQSHLLCTLRGAGLQLGWQTITTKVKRSGYCHWQIITHPEDPSLFQMRNAELLNEISDIGPVYLTNTGLYFDYGSNAINDPANKIDEIYTWWKWRHNPDNQDDMTSLPDHCSVGNSGLPQFMEEMDMREELMGRSAGGGRRRRSRFTFTSEDRFARCIPRWFLQGTKCYRIFSAPGLSQHRTEKICDLLGGKVVQPMSIDENSYIRALIQRYAPGREFWLGVKINDENARNTQVRDFTGSDGSALRFARWRRQRRLMRNQRCALFSRHGHWKPASCDILSGRVLCERDARVNELPGSAICGKIQERSVDEIMTRAAHGRESDVRIVNGESAVSTQFPWQAAIRFKKPVKQRGVKIYHNCGGALIDNCYVLTAAHCFLGDDQKTSYIVRVGDWRKTMDDGTEQEFELEELVIHAEYRSSPSHRNDIALIKLQQKNGRCAVFTDVVQPVCLPTPEFAIADEGERCQVSGWGATDFASGQRSAPETLQWVSIPTIRNSICAKRYNENKYNSTYFLPEVMFCAGYKEGGKDSCSGDSGGPYVCRGSDGRYAVAGIVSFGIGCARKAYPGVYTRVTHFLPWIREQILAYGDGNIIG